MLRELSRELQSDKWTEIEKARSNIVDFNRYVFGWETAPFQKRWEDLSNKHQFLALLAPIYHGKSSQRTISKTIRALGEDPNERILIVSAVYAQAAKFVGIIKQHIKSNKKLHEVYPWLRPEERPGRFQRWADDAFIVQREINEKDYSVQGVGIHGPVLGSRATRIMIDDPNNFANTSTPDQRKKTTNWIVAEVLSRFEEGATVECMQTAWHKDDTAHTLHDKHGFFLHKDQGVLPDGKYLWRSKEWHVLMRKILGEREYERQVQNNPMSDALSWFKMKFFELCMRPDLRFIRSRKDFRGSIVIGIDLATGDGEDETSFFTLGIRPNRKKQVLKIDKHKMNRKQTIAKVVEHQQRYKPEVFIVENNSFQKWLVQELQDLRRDGKIECNVQGFTTGSSKADPSFGVPSMTVGFENEEWIIPGEDLCKEWIQGFLDWTIDSHTDDTVMASWFASSWVKAIETGGPRIS